MEDQKIIPEYLNDSSSNLKLNLRVNQKLFRAVRRNDHIDAKRIGVGEIKHLIADAENITEKDIAGLASRIKRRRNAGELDQIRLSQAFLQSIGNIRAFINIPGALNVIVKELTGNDSNRKVLACECLCNMSLGSENCCEKLSMAAGSYLLMFLDSTNRRLADTALWTLTNLSVMPGSKSVNILMSQKIIPTLMATISINTTNPDFVSELYATLDIVVNSIVLSRDEGNTVLQQAVNDNSVSSVPIVYRMLYGCDFEIESSLSCRIVDKVLNSLDEIRTTTCCNGNETGYDVLQLIRILGNIFAKYGPAQEYFVKQLQLKSLIMSEMFNQLIESAKIEIIPEVLWVAASIFNSTNEYVQAYIASDNFLVNLKITHQM